MPTTLDIAQPTYNSYFGNISKVVWFNVNDNLNYFELQLTIIPEQTRRTSLTLYDYNQNREVLVKEYIADVQQSPIYDIIKILNVERTQEVFPYAIINNTTQ
jgi:hypothetical protein